MPYEKAAIVEPLAVALRAVERSGARYGDRVLVLGAGPIGLLITATLRSVMASEITVVEPSRKRRDLACTLGATSTHDPAEFEELLRERDADSFDVAIDSAGSAKALDTAILACRNGGRILCVSRYKRPATVDPNRLRAEVTLVSTQAYCGEFPAAIEGLMHGDFDVAPVVTKRISLEQIVEEGFEALAGPTVEEAKILVRCTEAT
jgi:(R,R)-butanediol dehydrogenase/meso-butanediol dehydrogenase/diacetyl reductase